MARAFFGGRCTLSVISENFAVVLSWTAIRTGCPKLQVSSDLELSHMSAYKTFLAVVLLHWVREL